MHIADTHIEISVFLCVDEEVAPGNCVRVPKATAFLTAVHDDPFLTGYVVTAAHVIEAAGDQRLYLRMNTNDGFDDVATERAEWFIHDRADVAVIRVQWTSGEPYNLYSIFPEQFVRGDCSLQAPGLPGFVQRTKAGDQISIIGLFVEQYGRSRSLPIVRTGTIARVPSLVRYKHPGGSYSEQFAYLVELHSHGGLSGSPVYVHRCITSLQEVEIPQSSRSPEAESAKVWVQVTGDEGSELINLLGLVSGHFDIAQAAETTGDIYGTITVAVNAGIAVVTPAEAIRELLWRDDVVEDRKAVTEAALKARADGSLFRPIEREIFHSRTS